MVKIVKLPIKITDNVKNYFNICAAKFLNLILIIEF